ncbi:PREDICTED: mediator of RNA polymerase II transcription subunit 33A-like isoform X2 [Tarenaya hassleriana]|uniref:mediator of RNA polymerase II transcription subunit 33A-like isoform X2 n=1 Tax=Tarenaya hassleriana TaxID=28532 RepID=UPI00053C5436|nr:PREDICTED: mediator of RNA polymerase II transcription subunit 33A-like isoform X2 [Tarenaya hassleriana]
MAPPGQRTVWDCVNEQTKLAQEKGIDPILWAAQLSASLNAASERSDLPSSEAAEALVSYICWDNNVPILWKFLEKAMTLKLVPPLLVLALLADRVLPSRRSQPAAYRLFLELLKRHAFCTSDLITDPHYQKAMKSIDSVLHLSEIFDLKTSEPGILLAEFIFVTVSLLVDASLSDEGLSELSQDRKSKWLIDSREMEIDVHEKRTEYHEKLQSLNTVMGIEVIIEFLSNKVTSRLLHLVRQNMPSHWQGFVHRVQILVANSSAMKSSKFLPEVLLQLISDRRPALSHDGKANSLSKSDVILDFGSLASFTGLCHGASLSTLWLPLDLVLEDAMDGYQGGVKFSGLTKTLKAINSSTWHDTFLALWVAALRLVQRERDPIEGPIPRLDTRLCMSLSIVPLVVANLIEHEDMLLKQENGSSTSRWKDKEIIRSHRADLITSLQVLGDFPGLLAPPKCVVSAANQAATKAMLFVSGSVNVGNAHFDVFNMKDMPVSCTGNMRHLIVEACITRNMLDTSAYSWPGYVDGRISQMPHSLPTEMPSWSSFLNGSPLNAAMVNALVSLPASSLAELEKIFEIAIKGSEDEKISAATVLCGASLTRGWNVQEHTVQFITRLLSPPVPADYSGTESHLIGYAPMLNVLIVGIGSVDCIQIFSLHGMVPQLACSIMPVCEEFGSYTPNVSWKLPTGEDISAHCVFSNAFTLLLKLWRFNHAPIEHGVGDVPTVGSQLTPEYLLLVRNSHLVPSENVHRDRNKKRLSEVSKSSSSKPVFVDSFPKLKVWHRQHQRCIAATLSGLIHGSSVHRTVESLLNMMFGKVSNRGGQNLNSGTSSSSGAGSEDSSLRPMLPAWDILEAVPYVVDAALTACSHGRLSPRELATGLKDLADFLPASLAPIVSYFSAEVSRGVWKPVFMNGMDWPSPAANLSNVEEYMKKILATTSVDIPSLAPGGSSPATLPLPLAAFVSLTITYKIDKASERFLNLAGPALECLAAGCPWPCMPIVTSLWTQKAKRWFDFLVFSASRTVFLHDRDAVVQLLRNCFSATLGLNATPISNDGGVGALLGHGFGSHFYGGISPVAPGILYLRMHRSLRDTAFVSEEIFSLLVHSITEISRNGLSNGKRYNQASLARAMARVKLAASLSASLVWLTGGLGVVHLLIKEILPSWFLIVHRPDHEPVGGGLPSGLVAELRGHALAHFIVLCGSLAWGVDSASSASRRRPRILRSHMAFIASAMDGKVAVGCESETWRTYVSGLVSLMVRCLPEWVKEMEVEALKTVSEGLRQWRKEELAFELLAMGGIRAMAPASDFVLHLRSFRHHHHHHHLMTLSFFCVLSEIQRVAEFSCFE